MPAEEGAASVLEVRAPAKVNLSLEVLGKRADGFHEIRTVMQAVSLCDTLRFGLRDDSRLRLRCADLAVPSGEDNLVVRAARLMQERIQGSAGADIFLQKRIPTGGGLGGGSSDAALTLLALNRLWNAGLGVAELMTMGAKLGSDVPFFVRGGTALCEGRGERVGPPLRTRTVHYVLVMPRLAASTAEVYRAWSGALTNRGHGSNNGLVEALKSGDARELARSLRNDLQHPALKLHEDLRRLWDELSSRGGGLGVRRFLLSGSGSTFFGVLCCADEAARASGALQSELGVPCAPVHSLPAWNGIVDKLTIRRRHL